MLSDPLSSFSRLCIVKIPASAVSCVSKIYMLFLIIGTQNGCDLTAESQQLIGKTISERDIGRATNTLSPPQYKRLPLTLR